MSRVPRTALSVVACALPVAFAWSSLAAGSSSFLSVLLVNMGFSLVLFLVCAAASHVILSRMNSRRLRDYVRVMFWVTTTLLFACQIGAYSFLFGSGGSELHLGVQVIRDGAFSIGGLALLAMESMFLAVLLAASFAVFWYLAVRPYAKVPADDA